MSAEVIHVSAEDATPSRAAAARAVDVLRAGGLVVLPTETLYGVAALASNAAALGSLAMLTGRGASECSTWHAAGADEVTRLVTSPLHRRVIDRLAPGPIRFGVALEALDRSLWPMNREGLPEAVADALGVLWVRVPSHPVARAVLAAVGAPIAMDRVPLANGTGEDSRALASIAAGLVLDAGRATHGKPSTTVRLTGTARRASYSVSSVGAVPERAVHRAVARRVLFVCTGNTCRSPMAEAIARARVGPGGVWGGLPMEVASAGVAASEGEPASPQTVEALRAVGVEPLPHRATGLSAACVREADVIYAMTESHARAVRAMGPEAAAKVRLLDPSGADIQDPVGGPVALYISTARRLDELIRSRLQELDTAEEPLGATP